MGYSENFKVNETVSSQTTLCIKDKQNWLTTTSSHTT